MKIDVLVVFRFKLEHLVVTQKIIETIQPRLIVVCNAEASEFFGIKANKKRTKGVFIGYEFDKDDNEFSLDEKSGCHIIRGCKPHLDNSLHDQSFKTNLVGTYVYFSSFNRYKSKFDKERMKWHLKHVYDDFIK